jgi:hypothetical protein
MVRRVGSQLGKRAILVGLVLAILVTVAACGPAYDYGHYSYAPTVPQLVDIRMTTGDDTDCALGVTATGIGVVTGVVTGGVSDLVAAFAWSGSVLGVGESLSTCWDEFSSNRIYFNVWTKCPGLPVLKNTFNNYGDIAPYIEFPSCTCSIGCINNIPNAQQGYSAGIHYWHAGANHIFGVTPPPDYEAMAASMGMTYGGFTATPPGQ